MKKELTNHNRQQDIRKNVLRETIPIGDNPSGHIPADSYFVDESNTDCELESNAEIYNNEDFKFSSPNESMNQFEGMTIKDLRKMTEDYKRLEKENTFLKRKYPTRANELNNKDFDINKFVESC